MTQYTQPDGIPVPQSGDTLAPLENRFSDQATATQAGLLRPSPVGSAAARDAAVPSPVEGQSVWRTDTHQREMYSSATIARTPGWYPVQGATPLFIIEQTNGALKTPSAASTWTGTSTANHWSGPILNRQFPTWDGAALTVNIAGWYDLQYSANIGTQGTHSVELTLNSATADVNVLDRRDLNGFSVQLNITKYLAAGAVVRPFLKSSVASATVVNESFYVMWRSLG